MATLVSALAKAATTFLDPPSRAELEALAARIADASSQNGARPHPESSD
jgi:hypothetical protein